MTVYITRFPKYIKEQKQISQEITLDKTCQNCGKKYEKKKEYNEEHKYLLEKKE